MIRDDPKIGHGTWSRWHNQIGIGCACATGTSRLAEPNLFHWVKERSKETSPSPMAQVIYLHRAIPFAMAQALTTMELVPVPLVPNCDKKWVYKAVQNFWRDFSGEDFREKHYLSTTLFPLIGCGVDSYIPELEHL